jgi:hypothetical protein
VRTLRSLAAALFLTLLASCGDMPTEQVQAPDSAVKSTGSFWISCTSSVPVGGSGGCSAYSTGSGFVYPSYWSTSGAILMYSSGFFVGRYPGYSTIYASANGYMASSGVRVYSTAPAAVTSVTVSNAAMYLGSTAQLTAKVYDQYGNQMTGQAVTWSIDNPAVASISGTGVVTGQSLGSTTARATVSGVAGAGTVSVIEYQEPTYPTCPHCQIP